MSEKESLRTFLRRKRRVDRRYVARPLNWRPILGVETGMVDDKRPDEPSRFAAKRIARRANRLDR